MPAFVLCYTGARAQAPDPERLDEALREKLENISAITGEETDFTTLLDQLAYFARHPLDLNTASRDDLLALVVLNDLQITALRNHIRDNGPLLALEELQSVDGFDNLTIRAILPFVRVGEEPLLGRLTWTRVREEGSHLLLVRLQEVTETAKGYTAPVPETNDTNRYLGSKLKLYSRYRFTLGKQISFGITAEKDQGEEFFTGTQPQGFDFYSAHLFLQGKGLVRTVAVGDFQAQYGQGLVLWSGLAYGKSSDVLNIRRNARGILPYTSVDENIFMRGAAVSIGQERWKADVFYSSHPVDGNLASSVDTLEQEDIVTSFQESGYHRTWSELYDKHAIGQAMYGGHVQVSGQRWQAGVTAYATEFDRMLMKNTQLYSQYDFQGDHNSNTGADVSYNFRNVSFFGETGRSENGGLAYLGGLLVSLDPRLAVSVLHRHYDRDYQALLSNGFGENSRTVNETGTYFGISVKPVSAITFQGYADFFHFPWLRYQVDAPSGGDDFLAQLTYAPTKTFEMLGRIRKRGKQENSSQADAPIDPLVRVEQTNIRWQVRYRVSATVTFTDRLETVHLGRQDAAGENGFLIYHDIAWKPLGSSFAVSFRYALFDSETYDSRIYAYESDVLYAFSIPAYYYAGSRYYAVVKWQLAKGLDLWLRYARTAYSDRKTVGSGLDEIPAPHKSEVKLQVRMRL